MPRIARAVVLSFTSILLPPKLVHADARTSFLVEQLKTNDDYRVRTQAALALGASGDDTAIKPLCDALVDSNVSVKVAAAAALGKLGKAGGVSCLEAARAKETAPAVKSQMEKSLASLRSGGGDGGGSTPPPPGPGAKYYVAIEVTNKTNRP